MVTTTPSDFIRDIIDADLASGKHSQVVTRFPPEPNGYMHIGHAKAVCLSFGLALQYKGRCNLRFDDTNPAKEDQEYVDSIAADIKWLGFDLGEGPLFASDYFDTMYEIAEKLIGEGKAYVCDLSDEQTREYRGSLQEAGKESPRRNQSPAENLDLFRKMRAGDFPDGSYVLRAKIDMAASNMKMRDPLLYRIRHDHHDRTGDTWPIYPMYDFAHPLEDALEGITHSLCTLEFENNRELYNWIVANSGLPGKPEQTEFARLALGYTIMSKRKLLQLVEQNLVSGWDDPRMPTIAGMRRRGYRAEAIVRFCDLIGVSKNNSTVDIGKLEYAVRDDLNSVAPRVMAVLEPIKLTITGYPEGKSESISAPYFPPDIGKPGERDLSFSNNLYIEASDFAETPTKGFRRLAPGRWIRLRHAYCVRCDEVIKDEAGKVVEVRCSYDPNSLGENGPAGEKVWGVIHWVDSKTSLAAEVRIYDRLFKSERPGAGDDFLDHLNPDSLSRYSAQVEASIGTAEADTKIRYQFERQGYFIEDNVDSKPGALVFNRTIGLRDSWVKSKTVTTSEAPEIKTAQSSRAATRPKSRTKADIRQSARKHDSALSERFARYQSEGLSEGDSDLLSGASEWGDRLEALVAAGLSFSDAAKWLINEQPREDDLPIEFASPVSEFPALLAALESRISSSKARKIWKELAQKKGSAEALIKAIEADRIDDGDSLAPIVAKIMSDNSDKVTTYRGGKEALFGFFVGQVMRAAKGKASAKLVKDVLLRMLNEKGDAQ
ncbi:MAG: glutamine--tRNA ligase/YqeY domain fusion protein [Kofleriaceae bacterium]|nr:glutamine--tRNA ligase/YqeY domain fusion protein [Kofleriaceae bacterium]